MSEQQQNQQLAFLQEKIKQIGSAIFYNESDSLVKLPTSVITSVRVDDFGYVWFFVKKPHHNLLEFEQEFPVRLDFFKKGVDSFMQVSGKGWVVTDPEEINVFTNFSSEDVEAAIANDLVLVKVKMLKAEFFETLQRTKKSKWWQGAVNTVSAWFGVHAGNTYYPAS